MAKAAFNRKKTLFTSKLDLNLRKKLVKWYIWSVALYGAETRTLWKIEQKYLESFEMWCWRRVDIRCTDHVRNEEVSRRVKGERNIIQTVKIMQANWIGHILPTNCVLKHVIEGKIEGVSRRKGKTRKKL
jgi:hypothetical protein